jgi:hypothetical protein
MLPSHVYGNSHIVSHDNEFRRTAVIIAAKAYDVDLSHSGRENSEMPGESQDGYSSNVGGTDGRRLPARGLARSWINYKTIT